MQKFFAGQTTQGATDWQDYPSGSGVYVDVDTSAGNFPTTPIYLASLGGRSHHWWTTGGSSIYNATANKFRIYIRWADGKPMTKDDAYAHQWFVSWIGIEP
jgi:hypothetical protein